MLTSKVASQFDPKVRARGSSYFAGGRVSDLDYCEEAVSASVRGSDQYDVSILFERSTREWRLIPECTCPFAEEQGGFCKHIWATLLAVEARGSELVGPFPARVRMESPHRDDEDFEPLRIGHWSSGGRGLAVKRKAPTKPSPVPGWQRMLQLAPTNYGPPQRNAPVPIGPVRYVLDVPRSRASGILTISLWRTGDEAGKNAGRPKKQAVASGDIARLLDQQDRMICGMLMGAAKPGRESMYGYDRYQGASASSLWQADHRMLPVLLPLLHQTGRFFAAASENDEPRPIRMDDGDSWELVLGVEGSDEKRFRQQHWVLRGSFRRGGERMALGAPDLLTDGEPGVMLKDGVLGRFEAHGCFAWIPILRGEQEYRVKKEDLAGLLGELGRRGLRLPVEWPSAWGVREVKELAPRGRLTLNAGRTGLGVVEAKVAFNYGAAVVTEGENGAYTWQPPEGKKGINEVVRRQVEAENRLAARLTDLGVKAPSYRGREVAVKKVPRLVAALLSEGWEVLGDKALYRRPGEFKIEVSSGIDWFDLNGSVDFAGVPASVAQVLEAARKGEHFVTLGDGSLGVLPEEWLEQHGKWLRLGRVEDGKVRFSKAQLTLIDALMAGMPQATCDAQVMAARKRLAAFDGVKERAEPKGFKGVLRPYQKEGLGWLRFLTEFGFGGCLADDMGLGKTVQLLAHWADLRAGGETGPWLVVAPKSLVFNWAREAERFVPGVRVLDFTGVERKGRAAALGETDLVLTTYGTLRKDVESLREVEFACVVLDEAQAIKNPNSQAAKAARLLRARRRLAMTGTPVENRLSDLWSIFEFLNPGMLGGAAAFGEALKGRDGEQDLGLLRRALGPFILRRTKDKVAPELPARSEQTIVCEMEPKQRAVYDGLRAAYRAQLLGRIDKTGMAKSKIHVLEALLRLRQAACHPGLIDAKLQGAGSAKVDELLERLEELGQEGHKALVFSQFTSLLDLVRVELDSRGIKYEYLDGKTPARERQQAVDRFQGEGGQGLFLISLKAGGVGLNLTAADYVFLLDPWWNPAVEAQAIDRTHRIGQEKKVFAYRLIARGTVEERILELQKTKRELAEAIVAGREGPLSSLTREDLEWLLS